MHTFARCLLALSAFPALSADAQNSNPTDIAPRTRVRIVSSVFGGARRTAHVVRTHGDTIEFRLVNRTETLPLHIDEITGLEESKGRRRHTGLGMLIGGASGVAAGIVMGNQKRLMKSCNSEGCQTFMAHDELAASFAPVLLGGTGAVVGLVVGALTGHDTWVDVPLRRPRDAARVVPGARGPLSVRITF